MVVFLDSPPRFLVGCFKFFHDWSKSSVVARSSKAETKLYPFAMHHGMSRQLQSTLYVSRVASATLPVPSDFVLRKAATAASTVTVPGFCGSTEPSNRPAFKSLVERSCASIQSDVSSE